MLHSTLFSKNHQVYLQVLGLSLLLIISASLTGCQEEGCTDPQAINYNNDADKSCDGCCDYRVGCMDEDAMNYDPNAVKSCDGCCNYKESADVKVKMSHNIDDQALELDKMKYTNPFNRDYKVTKLRYYVSDFRFQKANGNVYDSDTFYLVDVEDASTLSFTISDVPKGDYSKVSFYFGLDEDKNQDKALPSEETVMPWPSQLGDGYHYMQQEGFYKDSAGTDKAFNTHMGKKKVNDSTFEHNYITIDLKQSSIDINDKDWAVDIAMDINEWYKNPNDYDFPDFGQGIMGNDQAQRTLHDNGANAFTLTNKSEAD